MSGFHFRNEDIVAGRINHDLALLSFCETNNGQPNAYLDRYKIMLNTGWLLDSSS